MPGKWNLCSTLGQREANGPFRQRTKGLIGQLFLPTRMTGRAGCFEGNVFCGKFNTEGTIYLSACQDHNLRLYETSELAQGRPYKTIEARDVGWSVLDVDYSPDGRMLIYSSWSTNVHLCNVYGEHEIHDELAFDAQVQPFCLFSIKFSPDNREILGGANAGFVHLYDIETKRPVGFVEGAHEEDVNSVCFLDENPNVFLSASDDCLLKLWDRRMLHLGRETRSKSKPVGVFAGHDSGLAHVSSKGDGRYVITNGKDDCVKLWDMRQRTPEDKCPRPNRQRRGRFLGLFLIDEGADAWHSGIDSAVATFRGHRVCKTLIRASFSPERSTMQRYIYSGSGDGKVYIWDTNTGELVQELKGHQNVVRDVSWHPDMPMLVTASWDGSVGIFEHAGESDVEPPLTRPRRSRRGPSYH